MNVPLLFDDDLEQTLEVPEDLPELLLAYRQAMDRASRYRAQARVLKDRIVPALEQIRTSKHRPYTCDIVGDTGLGVEAYLSESERRVYDSQEAELLLDPETIEQITRLTPVTKLQVKVRPAVEDIP